MQDSFSKNVSIDKLYDIVNKYNNTYHNTIKMKPVDVKPNIYLFHLHNLLRLFYVLPNFSFITSETMCNYYL